MISHFDKEGDVVIPLVLRVRIKGMYEHDVNATTIDEVEIFWPDGRELTADDYNLEVTVGQSTLFLHELAVDLLLEQDS